MKFRYQVGWMLLSAASITAPSVVFAADRQIEEVVVTAERRESSVQDTSISITAFTSEMMEDFGIRNQTDLQNLVPATTIQPYDSAVRGVGRNFRNLGGDPGVATYMNGVYSEDLYTATIGSFWDIERIEVLRGPQGTLYGRNAVGGAMNFLYKKPSDEFEFAAKTVLGDYDTRDVYAMISGPILEGVLNGRLTSSSRFHKGWVDEMSGLGRDLDSGDENNIAGQLEWIINDNMTFTVRHNNAEVDRVFGGADGGGLIVLTGETYDGDLLRNYDNISNSLRAVDTSVTDPLDSRFINQNTSVLTFTNPTTGAPILAQRVRPGVDRANSSRNQGRSNPAPRGSCVFLDRDSIKGKDLCAYTNGLNNETFDQEGTQAEFTWDINEGMTFKYIFGYNQLMYRRITEDDSTSSLVDDRQFYVNHEAEYLSHEFQLFWDVGDNVTFTSGIFFYDATIDQRGDFFSSTGNEQFTDPNWAIDGVFGPGVGLTNFVNGGVPVTLFSAKANALASGAPEGEITQAAGSWAGDSTLGSIQHGPITLGTDLQYSTQTNRDAFAAYTQGVWDINDKFTLTVGLRFASDDIDGEEDYVQYTELNPAAFGLNLATINIVRGAVNPVTLELTGAVDPYLSGIPITFGLHRDLQRKDEEVTYRVNLDYSLTDDSLVYGSVTTGYRSGGFNLVFFSQTAQFEPEELIAYELGYKAQFLNNSLQFNASLYLYDYDAIHTRTQEACPDPATEASARSACAVTDVTTSIQAAPGAEIKGLEFEALYLATDSITLGANFSFTDTEYTKSFTIVDGADPSFPNAIYNDATNPDRRIDVKGNQLLQVPETKGSFFASYNLALGGYGEVDFLTTYSYISEVFFASYESELDRAPEYDRIDVRATWTSPSRTWIVAGFVNNVTDDIGIRQILRHGASDGYRRTAQVTEPRLYGVEVSYTLR